MLDRIILIVTMVLSMHAMCANLLLALAAAWPLARMGVVCVSNEHFGPHFLTARVGDYGASGDFIEDRSTNVSIGSWDQSSTRTLGLLPTPASQSYQFSISIQGVPSTVVHETCTSTIEFALHATNPRIEALLSFCRTLR